MAIDRIGVPAIFFDKDGTLIHDVPYNVDPSQVRFYDDAIDALSQLKHAGYKLFVISNQSGVARGFFKQSQLGDISRYLQEAVRQSGIQFDGIYYCPHAESDRCSCRKPEPGLILQAAHEHGIDLAKSWMIGDILHDVEAGNRAGCRTIHLNNGHETEWDMTPPRLATATVTTLTEAAATILQNPERNSYESESTAHHLTVL